MKTFYISSKPLDYLTIHELLLINNQQIALSETAIERIVKCRKYLDDKIKKISPPYLWRYNRIWSIVQRKHIV